MEAVGFACRSTCRDFNRPILVIHLAGDATFVSLPERGIHGNTHFAFSDLNNHQIADQITTFLAEKGLD